MSRTERPDERLRAVLAAAGLIFGVALIGLVKDRLAVSDRYLVGPVRLRVGALPASLEGHRDRLLAGEPLVAGPRSIFDPELPEDLRQSLVRRPWVAGVAKLRRRLPDGFSAEISLRSPVAVVCLGAERLAVDRSAVVLESESGFGPPDLPEIHLLGEDVQTVPKDGHAFRRSSILEALAVIADLESAILGGHSAFDALLVTAVLVGREGLQRHAGSADIDLLLDNGVRIAWGRSSLSPHHIFELPTQRKLDHLNRLLQTYPGLLGIQRVDLRFEDPLVYMRS